MTHALPPETAAATTRFVFPRFRAFVAARHGSSKTQNIEDAAANA